MLSKTPWALFINLSSIGTSIKAGSFIYFNFFFFTIYYHVYAGVVEGVDLYFFFCNMADVHLRASTVPFARY